MKNAKFFTYLLVVISTSLFVRCTPENISCGSTAKESIMQSQWSVDYYFSGQDKTAQLNKYTFSFIGNGTVKADDGSNAITGSWDLLKDASRNDVLQINMQESNLRDISNDWKVTLTSTDLLLMKRGESEIRMRKL